MRFEFATATRILFGKGTANEIAPETAAFGKRAIIITGSSAFRTGHLKDQLEERDIATVFFSVTREPSVDLIRQGTALARHKQCDVVIGIGGGSVIDTGKAIAAFITNPGDPGDFLEIIGKGRRIVTPSAPYIAIPTTAGTGAEVTKNAVLVSPEQGIKVSVRSPHLLPKLAIIDPALTCTLPPDITAGTGLDALTQCIEAYVSNKATPLTDALCQEGIRRAARSLAHVCSNGSDIAAREDMSLASLFSGLALANAGLGAVHGFAAAIGGKYSVPHGMLCGLLLPHVMEANITALTRHRSGSTAAIDKFTSLAHMLTDDINTLPSDSIQWITSLYAKLPLSHPPILHGDKTAMHDIVMTAANTSSIKGNPIELTDKEMMTILEKTFEYLHG